jgi:hypothetical protein
MVGLLLFKRLFHRHGVISLGIADVLQESSGHQGESAEGVVSSCLESLSAAQAGLLMGDICGQFSPRTTTPCTVTPYKPSISILPLFTKASPSMYNIPMGSISTRTISSKYGEI